MGLRNQVGNGCTQLVRNVGGKVRQADKPFLDSGQHVVEGDHKFSQFYRYVQRIKSHI